MRKEKVYSGMCVGGPRAATRVSVPHNVYLVPEIDRLSTDVSAPGRHDDVMCAVRTHRYIYREFYMGSTAFGLWAHETCTTDSALLQELFDGYHPNQQVR